jgi:hypothetical protein
MHRFHYSITTKADRALTWEIYRNWTLWNSFANIYGDLHWREGKPWEVGSRLQIEILKPLHCVIDHVITENEAESRLAWQDTAVGITIRQQVEFLELAPGETRVHTWGEVSPADLKVAGRPVSHLVTSFTETWYENFRFFCDQFVEAGTQV